MTGWKSLSAKFSTEELELVDALHKNFGWSKSYILRVGVRMLAERAFILYATMDPEHPVVKIAQPVVDSLKAHMPAEAESKENRLLEQDVIKMLNEVNKTFMEHNRRGPKPQTRKRGRPSSKN